MNDLLAPIIAIIVTIIIVVVIMKFLHKIDKNTLVEIDKSEINWLILDCPKCNNKMENGFSLAGKGITWRERKQKQPGPFNTVGTVLPNTFNLTPSTSLNISWHCSNCNLIVLDHSNLVRVRDA